jgi:hypothetical protein
MFSLFDGNSVSGAGSNGESKIERINFRRGRNFTEPDQLHRDEMDGIVKFVLSQADHLLQVHGIQWPDKHILNSSEQIGMPAKIAVKVVVDKV